MEQSSEDVPKTDIRRDDMLYIRNEGAKKLLISIPYAGGNEDSMAALLGSFTDSDILIPKLDIIERCNDEDLRNMYKNIYDLIRENVEQDKQEVTVLGYYVGSVLAMGLYEYLQYMDVNMGNLIFCGSLPVISFNKQGEIASAWDYIPSGLMNASLKLLGLDLNMSKERVELFRKEVRMAAKLLANRRKKVSLAKGKQLVLIYGRNDKLTIGWHKKYKNWSNYITGKIHVKCVEGSGRYELPK